MNKLAKQKTSSDSLSNMMAYCGLWEAAVGRYTKRSKKLCPAAMGKALEAGEKEQARIDGKEK